MPSSHIRAPETPVCSSNNSWWSSNAGLLISSRGFPIRSLSCISAMQHVLIGFVEFNFLWHTNGKFGVTIYLYSEPLILYRVTGNMKPITGDKQSMGHDCMHDLDANQPTRHMSMNWGIKLGVRRGNPEAQGEHANSVQTGWRWGLNPLTLEVRHKPLYSPHFWMASGFKIFCCLTYIMLLFHELLPFLNVVQSWGSQKHFYSRYFEKIWERESVYNDCT